VAQAVRWELWDYGLLASSDDGAPVTNYGVALAGFTERLRLPFGGLSGHVGRIERSLAIVVPTLV
jgi:hypothetical protein